MGMMLNADQSAVYAQLPVQSHTHVTPPNSSPHFSLKKEKPEALPTPEVPCHDCHCSHRLSSHAGLGSRPAAPTEQIHRDVGRLRPPLVTEGTPPSQRPGDHQPRAAPPDHGQSRQLSPVRRQSHLLRWLVGNRTTHCCRLLIWGPVNYCTTSCRPG